MNYYENSHRKQVNPEEIAIKRKKIFLSVIIINSIIGIFISVVKTVDSSEYYNLLFLLAVGIIVIFGILDYRMKQKYFRILLIFSASFTILLGLIIVDILYYISIGIMLGELSLLCYNFALGQKEDRALMAFERRKKNKAKQL
jgi:hypothetical protein